MEGPIENSTPIEAKSLSLLTDLASNPPQNLATTRHDRHPPLVLYIARVPGSRDVFLSPMKPRDKVVTAEDVQSSLYYIHVDRPGDGSLLKSSDGSCDESTVEESDKPPSSDILTRKPMLPARPLANDFLRAERPGHPSRPLHVDPQRFSGKPSSGLLTSRTDVETQHNVSSAAFTRKPIASGTSNPKHSSVTFDDFLGSTGSQGLDPHTLSHQRSSFQPLPAVAPQEYQSRVLPENVRPGTNKHGLGLSSRSSTTEEQRRDVRMRPEHSQDSGLENQNTSQVQEPGISLTLIRRDPASGNQWNVGKVLDIPLHGVSSSSSSQSWTSQKSKRVGTPICLDISNPGYSKFVTDVERVPDRTSIHSDTMEIPQIIFRRRLWMEGARFTDPAFGHRKKRSDTSETGVGNNFENGPLVRDAQGYLVSDDSARTTTFKGYAFETPWRTRCEFVTSGGGGSLRCIHISNANGGRTPILTSVSELRFNLPNAFSKMHSRQTSDDGSSKRRSLFGKSKLAGSLAESTRASMHENEKMDLALGQETAGGGFGGKQAKLGKLIIEDVGLQMMDLVVAANMGLWWRAYERTDKR
ncbi:hypothetical protein EJ05DRAFT_475020 [Pseudovirgaria hyperparasitica]|uniref:Uncharacterized protein n=1 Tax=Pseudovirgaria hyperparasitica TaxID=470096 RepID=A0A6A6WFU1_9PEZI|nr:uncharacterized protein EJ05DRAFT_475020 [Pseudovirgaria hyperparasitica]KAF2760001.1 hypothetical protein EJ05DRAFT_475020 [Pseudovirgaria hyperparasitica]